MNNNNNNNNNLINQYYNNRYNNIMKNNPLLNNSNYMEQEMMRTKSIQMAQHVQKLKHMQHMKKIQILKDIDKLDEDKIKDSVIKPKKIEFTKNEKDNIDNEFKVKDNVYKDDNQFKQHTQLLWNKRTNEPYKNILKDEDYTKKFEKEEDLIVHKVTDVDKDVNILEGSLKEKLSVIERHNDELKIIYSLDNKTEHKKKFEYNHTYKYRVKFKTSGDHNNLKKNKIDIYKKEQKKLEKNKKKIIDIFESMVNDDLISKDQLENLGIVNDNEIEIDLSVLEEKLSEELNSDKDSESEYESECESDNDSESESDNDYEEVSVKKRMSIKSRVKVTKRK